VGVGQDVDDLGLMIFEAMAERGRVRWGIGGLVCSFDIRSKALFGDRRLSD